MLVPDANLLLYAVHADSPQHRHARRVLEQALNGTQTVALAWLVLIAFVRLSTRRGILPSPLGVADALSVVDAWLARPHVRVLQPGPLHLGILGRLLLAAGTVGNLTNEAHLAAIAIEHDAEVLTFDRDFQRFIGLRCRVLS